MKIWDYKTGDLSEVSEGQYAFVMECFKNGANVTEAQTKLHISNEQLDNWKADPIFWPIFDGYLEVYARSRGLSPELIKQEWLLGISGIKELSSQQLKALNDAARALGMGQASKGFGGKVTLAPESTTIEFNDGVDNGPSTNK